MSAATVLTDRFDRALLYATHVHGGQVRKETEHQGAMAYRPVFVLRDIHRAHRQFQRSRWCRVLVSAAAPE
jgi:hypothetical protein